SPSQGAPGITVTISGNYFSNITVVKFNGVSATFTVDSLFQIRATVPSGATSGFVTVTGSAGTGQSPGSFTVLDPITITSFTPTSGPPGQPVTVTGSDFTGATQVQFNNSGAFFAVVSNTEIHTSVPLGASSGPIKITGPAGTTTSSGRFTVTERRAPEVTSFTPTSGPRGTEVTITGRGFIDAVVVEFDGANASFSIDSDTQLRAIVPDDGTTGRIRVANNEGDTKSDGTFSVTSGSVNSPRITSFSPSSGSPGTLVTLDGSGFGGTTIVEFNGLGAVFTIVSASQLQATVPDGATTGYIRVATDSADTRSSKKFTVAVSGPPPTVTAISPATGAPGSQITIHGTNFVNVTAVRIGTTSATPYTVDSPTQITATVPNSIGNGRVTVKTLTGSATGTDVFTLLVPPRIHSFSPSRGAVGTRVRISGSHFENTTEVRFGGVLAAFTRTSTTRITATVPAGASTGRITVTTPVGTATSSKNFSVKN
ncbi:MAG: IPT/TIG domain-containing protein, partial [Chloroflexi bacterium]|nr:IPT/TIG domain-containing protein [Chloroflexota bacterium]